MRGYIVRREDLAALKRQEMYSLFERHFSGVSYPAFVHDLEDKNWVVLIEDGSGRLHGFSTLKLYESRVSGNPAQVVCSGDTIIDALARRTTALARVWLGAVFRLRSLDPGRPWYWLLICSGFRTYRFMPVFWREFYPRHDAATPAPAAALMSRLAAERWGSCYSHVDGLVRFPSPQRAREAIALPDAARLADPHVAYFVRRNPGHASGDELVCLAEIRVGNLTAAGQRVLRDEAEGSEALAV